ncbi:hypothetical protein HYH03_011440 [Edaphochlamys debaryana]|uniref:Glucosamine inositolphosphorylceramide transferase 1 N-terminal domain-containing protein n=1 Tax=Edaphochlamys debaryana TaxID=47281 RepID=A0A836BV69_9CHLO|nr:hypothetical protein HYH03_011440 [Edaphochlamys debaryana]|eukprot:KAG2490135.1 hypothetical protein HYH03_011440 [Edaphochlamys debaryana]
MSGLHQQRSSWPPRRWGVVGFAAYVLLSLGLVLLLLIDPLIDGPSGLIKLAWFTSAPLSHGLDPCAWDYEGSWRIGSVSGDPRQLNFSVEPAINCATLSNITAVSFVADPFLYVPDNGTSAPAGSALAKLAGSESGSAVPWFAFFEMKNLGPYKGELGTAVSYDRGASWRYLGPALVEPFHLSYPLVMYDKDSNQYLMFAETIGSKEGSIRVYGTSAEAFPFGWKVVATKYPADPGWPSTRRWFQFGMPAKYVDTSPVYYRDRWWIFTTRVGTPPAGQPKYTLLLYTAETLLGEWKPHPAALAGVPYAPAPGGRVPFGIDADKRTARNGGRPFVLDGTIYRWAQDCTHYYGEAMTLLRADVADEQSYKESEVVRYEPTRDGVTWRSQRLHHVDVQRLPDGSWWGFADGDRYADGHMHFLAKEKWFVDLKAVVRQLILIQLGVVLMAAALLTAATSTAAAYVARRLFVCFPSSAGSAVGTALGRLRLATSKLQLAMPTSSAAAVGGGGGLLGTVAAVVVMLAAAVAVAVGLMAAFPALVPCPRWTISVPPLPTSPHFVPDRPFLDPAAPYDVTNLTVITGCSHGFFDRLENLVGSLQYWAPRSPVVVYDLGFTSAQLAQMRCWQGVEVRRFPWERYPAYVRERTNYAFKALVVQLGVEEAAKAALWLDCGLEVRSPLTPFAASMAAHGHVSAQQSTSPGRQGWPQGHMAEKYQAPYLNMTQAEYERVRYLPYCAAGVQGFVRGSAAHRLILLPAVACSLDKDRCIAPPGHSRDQHCYEQTAYTLNIRRHNFSTCLPREYGATSSTRKTSYDPRQSSAPIVVASRRHRQPKPYRPLLRRRPACRPDPPSNPWPSLASERADSSMWHASLGTRMQGYGRALLDFAVQAGCCAGLHVLAQTLLWAQVLAVLWHAQAESLVASGHRLLAFALPLPTLLRMTTTARGGAWGGGGGGGGGGGESLLRRAKTLLATAAAASAYLAIVSVATMRMTCNVV